MDNYKIKVKDEASSDEARDLFKKLGYHPDNSSYEPYVEWVAVFEDGSGSFYRHNMNLNECVEITIAQLRDLVVLKRNDVSDANYRSKSVLDGFYFKSCDGVFYFMFEGKWVQSEVNTDEGLEPITQAPALISGADAELVAQAKKFITSDHLNRFEAAEAHLEGHPVQFMLANGDFIDITSDTTLGIFEKDGGYSFRLKPQTIKVELEIPAPYKAKIGGRDDTSFVLNVGRHQYCYKNEEDYTKARDALEAVFDAAVRGTNS
ncbi:hypothetical protein NQ785_08590 [Acinetobacter baumannii]|nr:hypothetical protein [Acinetobacter baumannii]